MEKEILKIWVIEALQSLGGSARIFDVCKKIWINHESEIRQSETLLYTWQYDVRWAAQKLRDCSKMKVVHGNRYKPWELV